MHGAVIGSGVAGVAMTHALRQVGIEVDLFEKDPEPRSTGYQLNVLANGMYALSQIGLADGLRSSGYGASLRSAPFLDGRTGRLVRSLAVPGVDSEVPPRSFYRGELHRALLDSLRGAAPQCGRLVEEVSDEPDREKVQLRFSDGDVRDFDFVIGCDGAKSRIRKLLFPEHADFVPQFRALLFAAVVDLDGQLEAERRFAAQLRDGEFVQLAGPGRTIVLSAAGSSRFGVVISSREVDAADDVSTPERAKELARIAVGAFDDPRVNYVIDRAFWEEGNPLVWHVGDIDPLPSFHVGRVALSGDAAHAMIPVVGQGANQSFEDAMVLARELAGSSETASEARAGISLAFQRYSAERQPHVALIQAEARRRAKAMTISSGFGYRVSRFVFRRLPQKLMNRYENHVLKYAIADPICSIEAL